MKTWLSWILCYLLIVETVNINGHRDTTEEGMIYIHQQDCHVPTMCTSMLPLILPLI